MIWFWVVAAAITALVLTFVLRPLARRGGRDATDHEFDKAIYRDQMAEIDRDQARGLINAGEADNAKAEIARRLLAADRRGGGQDQGGPKQSGQDHGTRQRRILPAALLGLFPLAVLGGYLALGSPHLPSQPLAGRDMAEREALAAQVAEAESLARELQQAPDDLDGWMRLGRLYGRLDRWSDAAAAFARAVGLSQGAAGPTGAWGEALVFANQGTVTREAEAALSQVLASRPGDPRARYYLALAEAQAGRSEDALERWGALAAETPPGATWRQNLINRIEETAQEAGLDAGPYLARLPEAGERGPDAGDVAAAAGMSEQDRAAMIDGMVQSLADRLANDPDDVEGWLRLANAYTVLDRPADALDALDRAADAGPDDPRALRQWLRLRLNDWTVAEPMPADARQRLDRLVQLVPEATDVMMLTAVRAESLGQRQEALAHYRRLLQAMPADAPARATVTARIEALSSDEGGQ